jgi:hypothetical protein
MLVYAVLLAAMAWAGSYLVAQFLLSFMNTRWRLGLTHWELMLISTIGAVGLVFGIYVLAY